jgi:hypothetical protein
MMPLSLLSLKASLINKNDKIEDLAHGVLSNKKPTQELNAK